MAPGCAVERSFWLPKAVAAFDDEFLWRRRISVAVCGGCSAAATESVSTPPHTPPGDLGCPPSFWQWSCPQRNTCVSALDRSERRSLNRPWTGVVPIGVRRMYFSIGVRARLLKKKESESTLDCRPSNRGQEDPSRPRPAAGLRRPVGERALMPPDRLQAP